MAEWDSEFQVMFLPATGLIRVELRRKSDNQMHLSFDLQEDGARLLSQQLHETANVLNQHQRGGGKHLQIVPKTDPEKKN